MKMEMKGEEKQTQDLQFKYRLVRTRDSEKGKESEREEKSEREI